MDFDFSDEQLALREATQRWVERAHPFERRHRLAKAGGQSRAVWQELAELGLAGLCVPAHHEGLGLGPVEVMVVMEELGRGLVSAPWMQGAVIAPQMLAAGSSQEAQAWLPRIASGEALVVLAHQERGARYHLHRCETTARLQGQTWLLSGRKSLVAAGDEADAFIVPAVCEGHSAISLFLVDAQQPGVQRSAYPTQDGARAAELSLSDCPAVCIQHDALALLEQGIDHGIAAACAEAVGLMDKLTELTAEYLRTRRQFGVTLASFQALRHRMADVKMQLELARSMSYYATLKLGAPAPERRRALSQAKVQIGQSARFVGQQCTQLHGGIGVTDEYLGSHYFKRLTGIEMQFGDTLHHVGCVTDAMQDTAGVFV